MKALRLYDGLVALGLVMLAVFLFGHLDHFLVPFSDVFQYIGDSREYMQLSLPDNIHASPLNPILIGLLSLAGVGEYPEITSAVILSVVSALGTVGVSWLVFREIQVRWLGLLGLGLLAVHPLFLNVSLNTDSTPLFTFLVCLSFYLYWYRKNRMAAYLVSMVSFLARYEGVVVFVVLLVMDWLRLRKASKIKWKPVLVSFVVMVGFVVMMVVNNRVHDVPYGNYYVYEVVNRFKDIPQWQYLVDAPLYLMAWDDSRISGLTSVPVFIWGVLAVVGLDLFLVIKRSKWFALSLYLFLGGYIAMHILFPAMEVRYFYPIVVMVFWLMVMRLNDYFLQMPKKWRLPAVVSVGLVSFGWWTAYSDSWIYANLDQQIDNNYEYRLLGEWLNQQDFGSSVDVLSYRDYISNFYTDNPQVTFVYSSPVRYCDSFYCVFKGIDGHMVIEDLLFVTESPKTQHYDEYAVSELGVLAFNNPLDRECMTKVVDLGSPDHGPNDRWMTVYQYDYEKCKQVFGDLTTDNIH